MIVGNRGERRGGTSHHSGYRPVATISLDYRIGRVTKPYPLFLGASGSRQELRSSLAIGPSDDRRSGPVHGVLVSASGPAARALARPSRKRIDPVYWGLRRRSAAIEWNASSSIRGCWTGARSNCWISLLASVVAPTASSRGNPSASNVSGSTGAALLTVVSVTVEGSHHSPVHSSTSRIVGTGATIRTMRPCTRTGGMTTDMVRYWGDAARGSITHFENPRPPARTPPSRCHSLVTVL